MICRILTKSSVISLHFLFFLFQIKKNKFGKLHFSFIVLDEQILPFVAAVKRLFLSYIKNSSQKEKSFGCNLDCPLQIMLTYHSAKGFINFFQKQNQLMFLKNSNELRYSSRKPLKMFRKKQYQCFCWKIEDLTQRKCRKSARNGPETYKNWKTFIM